MLVLAIRFVDDLHYDPLMKLSQLRGDEASVIIKNYIDLRRTQKFFLLNAATFLKRRWRLLKVNSLVFENAIVC